MADPSTLLYSIPLYCTLLYCTGWMHPQIREKQAQNKSRQKFWELTGSKLGDILGMKKTAEQVGGGDSPRDTPCTPRVHLRYKPGTPQVHSGWGTSWG